MLGGGGEGLQFLDFLFCYVFETNLSFIYYISEKSRSLQNSHNIWDCALCDIIFNGHGQISGRFPFWMLWGSWRCLYICFRIFVILVFFF